MWPIKAALNGKPPCLTEAFVCTVCEIEHGDVVSSGILAEELHDKRALQWTKPASNTLEKATESYMVEVIAECHF